MAVINILPHIIRIVYHGSRQPAIHHSVLDLSELLRCTFGILCANCCYGLRANGENKRPGGNLRENGL